jgi:hypothetical protein
LEHSRSLSGSLRVQDATFLRLQYATFLLLLLVVVVLLLVLVVLGGGKAGAAAARARISEDGVEVDHGERAGVLEAVRVVRGEEVAHRAAHGLEALRVLSPMSSQEVPL